MPGTQSARPQHHQTCESTPLGACTWLAYPRDAPCPIRGSSTPTGRIPESLRPLAPRHHRPSCTTSDATNLPFAVLPANRQTAAVFINRLFTEPCPACITTLIVFRPCAIDGCILGSMAIERRHRLRLPGLGVWSMGLDTRTWQPGRSLIQLPKALNRS
jgi:hypothetical protein